MVLEELAGTANQPGLRADVGNGQLSQCTAPFCIFWVLCSDLTALCLRWCCILRLAVAAAAE